MFKDFLKKIALFQVRKPWLTLAILLAITIILIGGMGKVRTVASMEQMMPPQVDEIKAFNTLRDNHLGQDMVAIVVEVDRESSDPNGVIDIRDKRVADYVSHLKELIESNPDIRSSYASTDIITMASGNEVSDLSNEAYMQIMQNPQAQEQLSYFISPDYTTTIIIATTDVAANDERMNLLARKVIKDIDSAGKPQGTNIRVTGTPVIQQKLGELIAKDRSNTQWISTILVFLITMIIFGTFTSALVPILVVTLSVNWLYGIMGYTNLPISTLAGGVAAMVIGIGIDYSIHMMNKFKNERKKGLSVEEAITKAVTETGTALTGAAIATVLAFLAFLLGSMPEMNRFGLLMGIGVGTAFILSIYGLPALLIIEEKIIHKIRKRVHFGVEGEYMLCSNEEIHPESHKETKEVTDKELRTILKGRKIVKRVKRK